MSKSKKRAAPSEEGSRKRKKQKKSPYQVDESLLNVEAGINESFSVMDSQLLADYTAQKITRFGSDLSSIEVADLTISGKSHDAQPSSHASVVFAMILIHSLPLCFIFTSPRSILLTLVLSVAANAIVDTTSWQSPRTTENLTEFLEKFAEKPERLSTAPEAKGTPHTIIVTGAGLRAANLVRYEMERAFEFAHLRSDMKRLTLRQSYEEVSE